MNSPPLRSTGGPPSVPFLRPEQRDDHTTRSGCRAPARLAVRASHVRKPIERGSQRREAVHARLVEYADVDSVVQALRPTEPLFCLHPAELRRNVARFQSFPGRALYAVKCNPHPFVLETLYRRRRSRLRRGLAQGGGTRRVPVRQGRLAFSSTTPRRPGRRSAPRAASSASVSTPSITLTELQKLLEESKRDDDLVVAVRLSNSSRDARYALSTKFGAPPEAGIELLRAVHRAGVRTGLSFHVGSQCLAPAAFGEALRTCGQVIRKAGVPISVLNVGGGFPAPYPGDDPAILEQYFASIIFGHQALRLPPGCLLFCEPGRGLVATAASVLTQVLLRKDRSIYLNDGIFGSLQELRHPKERRPSRIIRPGKAVSPHLAAFRVYGPTCDSDDVLGAPFLLPDDVAEGDWLEIGMMGAYSIAMQTQFNGFSVEQVVVVEKRTDVKAGPAA